MSTYEDALLHYILSTVRTIATAGVPDKETRPSQGVFQFLLAQSYKA
jgi:predicted CoA-binding protein